jgi:hypothetical protein
MLQPHAETDRSGISGNTLGETTPEMTEEEMRKYLLNLMPNVPKKDLPGLIETVTRLVYTNGGDSVLIQDPPLPLPEPQPTEVVAEAITLPDDVRDFLGRLINFSGYVEIPEAFKNADGTLDPKQYRVITKDAGEGAKSHRIIKYRESDYAEVEDVKTPEWELKFSGSYPEEIIVYESKEEGELVAYRYSLAPIRTEFDTPAVFATRRDEATNEIKLFGDILPVPIAQSVVYPLTTTVMGGAVVLLLSGKYHHIVTPIEEPAPTPEPVVVATPPAQVVTPDLHTSGQALSAGALEETTPENPTPKELRNVDSISSGIMELRGNLGLTEEEKTENADLWDIQFAAIKKLFTDTAQIRLLTAEENRGKGYLITTIEGKEIGLLTTANESRSIIFTSTIEGKPQTAFEFPPSGEWHAIVSVTKEDRKVIHKFGTNLEGKPIVKIEIIPPVKTHSRPTIYVKEGTPPADVPDLLNILRGIFNPNVLQPDIQRQVQEYHKNLTELISIFHESIPQSVIYGLFTSFLKTKRFKQIFSLKAESDRDVLEGGVVSVMGSIRSAMGVDLPDYALLYNFMANPKIKGETRPKGVLRTNSDTIFDNVYILAEEFFLKYLLNNMEVKASDAFGNKIAIDIQEMMFSGLKQSAGLPTSQG